MRRGIAVVALLVVILMGIGIGVAAYQAGERNGIAQGIEQVQVAQTNGQEVQVVHVVDQGHPFFFPGFFLFPLFLFGTFFLIGGIFRARGGGVAAITAEARGTKRAAAVRGTRTRVAPTRARRDAAGATAG